MTTATLCHYDNNSEVKEQDSCAASVRCMGPYQVSESIWLTSVWLSDAPELFRVLNINKDISEGLHSSNMTFPFPEANAVRFTERHLQRRNEAGVVTSWAIRTSIAGPIIGLFAMDSFDHGDVGHCYRDNIQQTHNHVEDQSPRCADTIQAGTLNCGGLGYWISPEYAGKGIMSQVVSYGVNHLARKEFGYDRIHGEAWMENKGSQRVMENTGMRRTVGVPCFVPKFSAVRDIAHYIIDVATP
ncbi:hypothetical protein BGZ79_010891 [Entomortierella chlamydospora]|nr:hypothetical protein BGZ79_010891 [Entomortierella chlamydospora]